MRSKIYLFNFVFWPCLMACRTLVPLRGIESRAPTVKAPSPKHWTAREFPGCIFWSVILSIHAFLSLQEFYGPWTFWHLQPIETAPRMPVLILYCPPDISVIFRHQLCPLLPDWSHLSETWHVGRLPQSSIEWPSCSRTSWSHQSEL